MTLAVILVPLIAAMLMPLLGGGGLGRFVALVSAGATFILALRLPSANPVDLPWLPDLGVTFSLSGSGAATVLVGAAALAMIGAVWYAGFRVTHRTSVFLALLLAMQAFLNGIFLAKDLVIFYVFWEATLIPSLVMLGVWGGSAKRRAVMKYLVYAMGGSLLMLVGIIALRITSGAEGFHFDQLAAAGASLDLTTQLLIFAAFAVAFAVKLPLVPVHSWLIDFHDQNHPGGVADVAGTLYKVGAFGFFAWAIPLLPAAAEAAAPLMLALAAITALYGGVVAAAQTDLKRLLAYASLSHMGIIGVGVFSLSPEGMTGAMLLLAAQMVSTSALFILAGMLGERRGTFDLSAYGGLARSAPFLASLMLFAIFASIGVPGLGNFPGEFLSLLGAWLHTPGWAVVATLTIVAAGVYGVNLYQRLFQGREQEPAKDLSVREALALVPFVAGILWFGIAPAAAVTNIELQTRAPVEEAITQVTEPLASVVEDSQ